MAQQIVQGTSPRKEERVKTTLGMRKLAPITRVLRKITHAEAPITAEESTTKNAEQKTEQTKAETIANLSRIQVAIC